jgi:hypothetical protein
MKTCLALLLIAGCSFPTPSEQYACVTTADCDTGRICDRSYCVVSTGNAVDSPRSDTSDSGQAFDCTGWTPRHFDACMIPQPTGPLALTGAGTYIYDTTDGSLTDPVGVVTAPPNMLLTAGRVLSVESLDVGAAATLRVIGTRPLVVAAWTTISVSGTINAGSLLTGNGAGANPAACAAHPPTMGVSDGNGAGGGGGAGFAATGGRGGNGDAGGGGPGGAAVAAPLLLGGCPGATGGTGDAAGGAGGAGGGAVQLTARTSVTVTATGKINAGGAGGAGAIANGGADAQGGGGGGGTGGMIGLQGATIIVDAGAILAANGGGGGGGASQGAGGRGTDGQLSTVRATGGSASNNAGIGGLGAAGLVLGGGVGQNSTPWGGGGGGGSVGFITMTSATPPVVTAGATVSPAQTIVP